MWAVPLLGPPAAAGSGPLLVCCGCREPVSPESLGACAATPVTVCCTPPTTLWASPALGPPAAAQHIVFQTQWSGSPPLPTCGRSRSSPRTTPQTCGCLRGAGRACEAGATCRPTARGCPPRTLVDRRELVVRANVAQALVAGRLLVLAVRLGRVKLGQRRGAWARSEEGATAAGGQGCE